LNTQSRVIGHSTTTLDGERASGVAYCMAHHVKVDGPERSLKIAAIRTETRRVATGLW